MLGLFDSGLGGLTVLRRLRVLLPQHDLLFYADQAHVPYGDRTTAELTALLAHNAAYMNDAGVDAIIMACNTSCATASQQGWPASNAPILDLIDSAAIAMQTAGYRQIGVVATAATARSGAYKRKIQERVPGAQVTEVAAPALVPLIEAGKLQGAETRAAVEEACRDLPRTLEAVILACTHYPLLDEQFAAVLGDSVVRVDPAVAHAQRAATLVAERGFAAGSSAIRCVTNADLKNFRSNVSAVLGPMASAITYEQLEPLELS